ncbi:MAG: hypothetical protein CVU43_16470 [Chloroflexi bacterium HGW-Chloroflexi-5]|nr:MAG: hypothetical protein CVU43_16470 [Chloroflexi bacterium HGW-Chloroflexi-5]
MISKYEGIDKISIAINPMFLNPFRPAGLIDPTKKITLHFFGWIPTIDIHAEALDYNVDFHYQLSEVISWLIEKNVLLFPKTPITQVFVHEHLDYFVLYLRELEFYFDFTKEQILIDKNEYDSELSIEERNFIRVGTTFYSKDFRKNKHKSKLIIYDRNEKLKHSRNKKYREIESNEFSERLEFRLCANNCAYMHMDNIKGNYEEVFNNYLPFLSALYNIYIKNSVTFSLDDTHPNFNKIIKKSKKCGTRSRNNLKKQKGRTQKFNEEQAKAEWDRIDIELQKVASKPEIAL